MAPTRATFLFAARDQPGLVARLAGFFYELALNIVDGSDHVEAGDLGSARFFIRQVVELDDSRLARGAIEAAFGELAAKLDGTWSVSYSDRAARVAILVTKESACLYDLILRQRQGELACEIPLVIGNHATLESVAQSFRIPFVVLPITPETKRAQEDRMLELLASHHIDLVEQRQRGRRIGGGVGCRLHVERGGDEPVARESRRRFDINPEIVIGLPLPLMQRLFAALRARIHGLQRHRDIRDRRQALERQQISGARELLAVRDQRAALSPLAGIGNTRAVN